VLSGTHCPAAGAPMLIICCVVARLFNGGICCEKDMKLGIAPDEGVIQF